MPADPGLAIGDAGGASPAASGLRVAFAGTPAFAAAALAAIARSAHALVGVLTQPDRPAGRGLQLQPSDVKREALRQGLPVAQPRSLRLDGRYPDEADAARQVLQSWAPDVLVVAAYGLILPRWTLQLPRLGCLNIHASLLPRWRGAAPIHRAVEAGDAQTGITIMQMDEGLDTGPMLRIAPESIRADDSTARLHDRLAALGAREIVLALDEAAAGCLRPVAQPDGGITYAHKVDKAEAGLDFHRPAGELARRVRAFDPFPGAHVVLGGTLLKVWRAEALAPPDPACGLASPGQVLAAGPEGLDLACGAGSVLRVLEVQRAGGRRMAVGEHLAGHPVAVGARAGGPSVP